MPEAKNSDNPESRLQRLANQVVYALRTQNADELGKRLSGIMLGSLNKTSFPLEAQHVITQLGSLESTGPIRIPEPNEALLPLHFSGGERNLRIVLDEDGKIIYLRLLAYSNANPPPEYNATDLMLPFNGVWLVYWGGDSPEVNAHHGVDFQNHAVDFIRIGKNGLSHVGEGTNNEDYYCYGQNIMAPANGRVADVINGVRDNRPGYMNPYSALGNCILLQHHALEYSLFAHLQRDSIRVVVGQTVKGGQIIGKCGNSGNSSEPHLHFQLQNSLLAHDAISIRPGICSVSYMRIRQSHEVMAYSPLKGDSVMSIHRVDSDPVTKVNWCDDCL